MVRKGSIRLALLLGSLAAFTLAWADASPAPETVMSPQANPEAAAEASAPAPVRFRDRELFVVSDPLGAMSSQDRAQTIENRLMAIARGPATALDTLHVAEKNGLSQLYVGDALIRAVSNQDALATGRTRQQLAADQILIIRQALEVEFRDRGVTHVIRGIGLSAGATLVILPLLWGLRWLHRWIRERINRAAQNWHWRSGLAQLKLLSPASVANASRAIAMATAMIIGLLLVYFYVEFVLSLFPWTRGLADQMVTTARRAVVHILSGVVDYLPDLLNIIVIVVLARYLLKGLKALFDQVGEGKIALSGFHTDWAAPTYAIVRFFAIAIAAVMIFPYLPGAGSTAFQGVATFLGLALSFGGAPAIGNIIAGTILTYMRPFDVGDRVKIADAIGDVASKNLLVVRLRTIKNVEISIPNALVLANHIINFSANAKIHGLILHTTVTIGYDVPWKTVHDLLIRAATRVEGILANPAPFVLQTSLDDFYVAYEINAYTDRPNDQTVLYSELHTQIQDSFNEGGVEIMSPHYAAVRDGNMTTVPGDYLPRDYQAPSFNILSRIMRPTQGT